MRLRCVLAAAACLWAGPWRAAAEDDEAGFLPIDGVKTTYKILQEGTAGSAAVEAGSVVTVHATGIVRQTGKKFWSTKDPGQKPFTYTAGGGVIKGWDMGARGMLEKEVRMLHIPADEGYGAKGFPAWGIPPGGDLNFELEVLTIKGSGKKRRRRKAKEEV
mmetsp:Transcript_32625/g.85613  ORF Transcript_32625/g.85613 Transcript_32625/m.85613 type:complete len:161 (+) Transcript_32625:44-526(+)